MQFLANIRGPCCSNACSIYQDLYYREVIPEERERERESPLSVVTTEMLFDYMSSAYEDSMLV